jgi:cardiolipin synthase
MELIPERLKAIPFGSRLRRSTVFPWRDDATYQLLTDPDNFLPAMLGAIRTAQKYILLEMYLVQSGEVTTRFIDALLEAAARGISVYIIWDDFGSRELDRADRERLGHGLIQLAIYNPFQFLQPRRYIFRDHRKLLLVDGRVAYTGGVGLSDEINTSSASRPGWHDIVLESTGKVVLDSQRLFAMYWEHMKSVTLDLPEQEAPLLQGSAGRLVYSQPMRINAINAHLRQQVARAENRVWLATAYFLPPSRLRRALRRAARNGVDVRILLPGPISDAPLVRFASQRFYMRLLKAGIRIYEYQPKFMHAKVALVDDWVSLGSSNFDRWSLLRNLEANQEIISAEFAAQVEVFFNGNFPASREIYLDKWRSRSWRQRWREQVWGRVEAWLDRER